VRARLPGWWFAVLLALAACRPRVSPPAEVDRIAGALRGAGYAVDRVARNSNGGWSVVFDEGEVQWFHAPTAEATRLHPIRVMYRVQTQPALSVVDLHPTVFLVIMAGRHNGERLELGTGRASPAEIEAGIRAALRGQSR
jgi:hypothetical protein